MPQYIRLTPGDPAPWFAQRSFANPRYVIDTAAGRYIVLCFYGSAADPQGAEALKGVLEAPGLFDDLHASVFAVSHDPQDEAERRVADRYPGFRVLWDFDGVAGRLMGALPRDADGPLRRFWLVLDPAMRVLLNLPFAEDRSDIQALIAFVRTLPPVPAYGGSEMHAPVLMLPNVFEPDFCHHLIRLYQEDGGRDSGFMRDIDQKTTLMHDPRHKRRRDFTLTDDALMKAIQARVQRRIVPMIQRAFQFGVTRMERYLVACYSAQDEAHFRPHRDNTTLGTAHRRFAVSINLNDTFEGGEISFPEYGPRSYKPPPGSAVVFSCTILHAVSRVEQGERYAFLPFLYDDAAAALRQQNARHLAAQPTGAPED